MTCIVVEIAFFPTQFPPLIQSRVVASRRTRVTLLHVSVSSPTSSIRILEANVYRESPTSSIRVLEANVYRESNLSLFFLNSCQVDILKLFVCGNTYLFNLNESIPISKARNTSNKFFLFGPHCFIYWWVLVRPVCESDQLSVHDSIM